MFKEVKEFLIGSPQERKAGEQAKRLANKSKLTPHQEAELNNALRMSRRHALRLGAILGASAIGASTGVGAYFLKERSSQPEPLRNPDQYIDPKIQQLGREIENWSLGNNFRMATVFPDIGKAAEVLQGKVDPRKYIPTLALPIGFSNKVENAAFEMTILPDEDDPRKIEISLPNGEKAIRGWSNKPSAVFRLSSELERNDVRMAVMTKEASQLYDYQAYCELYLQLLNQAGVTTRFINPTNIQTSAGEVLANTVKQVWMVEEQKTGTKSLFIDLVDAGSGIKVGGIMFANWYVDQLNKRLYVPDTNTSWVKAGHDYAGFLQEKGLIVQRPNGGIFVWKNGKSPEINSPEFSNLFFEFTARRVPNFK